MVGDRERFIEGAIEPVGGPLGLFVVGDQVGCTEGSLLWPSLGPNELIKEGIEDGNEEA